MSVRALSLCYNVQPAQLRQTGMRDEICTVRTVSAQRLTASMARTSAAPGAVGGRALVRGPGLCAHRLGHRAAAASGDAEGDASDASGRSTATDRRRVWKPAPCGVRVGVGVRIGVRVRVRVRVGVEVGVGVGVRVGLWS